MGVRAARREARSCGGILKGKNLLKKLYLNIKMTKNKVKSGYAFHIIVSPREYSLSLSELLNDYLSKHCHSYVISEETGENGHQHVDAFAEFNSMKRVDNLQISIRTLYEKIIPKQELQNVKVKINFMVPDLKYGYGYSLKEGNPLYSVGISEDYKKEALQFYLENSEKVEDMKAQDKNGTQSCDQFVEQLINFLKLQDRQLLKKLNYVEDQMQMYYRLNLHKLPFSQYSKINWKRLTEYVCDRLYYFISEDEDAS